MSESLGLAMARCARLSQQEQVAPVVRPPALHEQRVRRQQPTCAEQDTLVTPSPPAYLTA